MILKYAPGIQKKELLYLFFTFILAEILNKTNKKSKYMKFPKIVNENRNFLYISKVCFLYNKEGLKSTERKGCFVKVK